MGIVGGLVSGLLLGAMYAFADATAQSVAQLDPPFLLTLAVGLGAPSVAGVIAARRSGSVQSGAVAGLWAALVGSLLLVVIAMTALQLFAGRLEAGPWLGDPRSLHVPGCARAVDVRLGSCQSGDTVGGLERFAEAGTADCTAAVRYDEGRLLAINLGSSGVSVWTTAKDCPSNRRSLVGRPQHTGAFARAVSTCMTRRVVGARARNRTENLGIKRHYIYQDWRAQDQHQRFSRVCRCYHLLSGFPQVELGRMQLW